MKKKQPAEVLPYRAAALLEKIGARISLARRARLWTQADLAAKIGVSPNTMVAIEKGRANVAIGLFVKALWALDLLDSLSQVASHEEDDLTIAAGVARIPKRVRDSAQEDLYADAV